MAAKEETVLLSKLARDRRDLAELDRMRGTLRDARDLITNRLEIAAGEVLAEAGKPWGECTGCWLKFHAFGTGPLRAVFVTDCSWCGEGDTVSVDPVALEDKVRGLDSE